MQTDSFFIDLIMLYFHLLILLLFILMYTLVVFVSIVYFQK